MSRMVATGRVAEAYGLLCGAVRLMLFATFAAQVCMTLAGFEAAYLIWGLFSSRFSVADAQATGTVLAFLCLGLGGWAAQTVISRGFYALGSTWLPTIRRYVGRVPCGTSLRRSASAMGRDRSGDRELRSHSRLRAAARLVAISSLRARGGSPGQHAQSRARHAGAGTGHGGGGRHRDRCRALGARRRFFSSCRASISR
jgi:hypothetical protein